MSLPLAGVAVPLQQPTRFARPRQAVSIVEEKEEGRKEEGKKGKTNVAAFITWKYR
jgi:hypothetical protein